MKMAGKFVTLETRGKLGGINFRKDFWDWGQSLPLQSLTCFLRSRVPLQFIFRGQLRKLDLVQRLVSAIDGVILTISNSFSFSSYSTFSSSSLKSGANALQFSCLKEKSNEVNISHNKPFPSNPKPPFQNEAKCEAIDTKMILNSHANKSYFPKKGLALQ